MIKYARVCKFVSQKPSNGLHCNFVTRDFLIKGINWSKPNLGENSCF